MSDQDIENTFIHIRWADTDGKPVCIHCGCQTTYQARRKSDSLRFRCKACRRDFSITSGTLFAFHKLPLRIYLAAIVIFCNEVRGKSALALSRDLGCQYKTAYVLAHKIREAMGSEVKGMLIGGDGETVEVDGAYFGGYVKPSNLHENRRDRRKTENKSGKRRVVVVLRERGGRTLTNVFRHEADSFGWIVSRVSLDTRIIADEATSWNDFHAGYRMDRIDHSKAYSKDGACTNGAEGFFSRLRRAEVGHHHHIAGPYLGYYAREAAWREDHRRTDNGWQAATIIELAAACKPSVDWSGYWQRNRNNQKDGSVIQ